SATVVSGRSVDRSTPVASAANIGSSCRRLKLIGTVPACFLVVEDRDGAGPARRGAANLNWEAADRESMRRQRFEVMQLFEVTITDLAPGLVPLPDQPGIAGLGIAPLRVHERRVPAPAV